ncbi:MAG: rRNA maturation RNase YbeY [Deltaproteobacteria bacterium]
MTRKAPASAALPSRQVRAIGERMLRFLARDTAELSILLTDDAYIRTLNRDHRGKDRPTDVLAFSQEEDAEGEAEPAGATAGELLGDVVISLDTAERQARGRRRALLDEVSFLLAHGILHLVGYDHQDDAEEARMSTMTRRLIRAARR